MFYCELLCKLSKKCKIQWPEILHSFCVLGIGHSLVGFSAWWGSRAIKWGGIARRIEGTVFCNLIIEVIILSPLPVVLIGSKSFIESSPHLGVGIDSTTWMQGGRNHWEPCRKLPGPLPTTPVPPLYWGFNPRLQMLGHFPNPF